MSAAKAPVAVRRARQKLPVARIAGMVCLLVFVMVAALAVRLRMNIGRPDAQKSLLALRNVEAESEGSTPETMRSRLLAYIAERNNSGQDFEEQLLGQARLELYKPDAHEVCFSLPAGAGSVEAIRNQVSRFIADPARIEIATEENGRLNIGDLSLDKRPDRAFLFKTPEQNIRFDADAKLSFRFERATYTVSLREAVSYITNHNAQGGKLQVRTGERVNGREKVFFNHGAFVARHGEPSLVRLVEELTGNIPATASGAREKRIQRLLDFVSREIIYDNDEAASKVEILKHPVETLISRHGDCSNKAILFGSLLEQLGEDYVFLYCPEHITVAVKQGGFETRNNLTLRRENQVWVIAETTAPGFQIGLSRLDREWIIKSAQYVQHPDQPNVIYDLRTGAQAAFR
ncbi:MAG: transglutaminase-like domain-containing protein [Blastocatellia bacterium]